MESLNDILNKLSNFKDNQRLIVNEANNLRIADRNDHFEDAKNLIDMSKNCSEQINNSLKSIESYKHIIQKISFTNDEIRLPISHVDHNATTSFTLDTMTFINYLNENTANESAQKLIISEISSQVQTSIQDLRKEMQNCKFITSNVEILTNNLNVFENAFDAQLDTSLSENVPLESIQE